MVSCSNSQNKNKPEDNSNNSSLSNEDSFIDSYLRSNLPNVLQLQENELNSFKKTMVFDDEKKLESWNIDLLEKAYPIVEEYTDVTALLYHDLGDNPDRIIIVGADGKEKIYTPSFYDRNKKEYPLEEVKNWNAIFYVVTTNCGYCVSEFSKMNELSEKYKNKDIKFVAFFERMENIDNYLKGEIVKTKGFLNDDWLILGNKKSVSLLTSQHNDSIGYPFIFFRKDKRDLNFYPDYVNKGSIEQFISENFK